MSVSDFFSEISFMYRSQKNSMLVEKLCKEGLVHWKKTGFDSQSKWSQFAPNKQKNLICLWLAAAYVLSRKLLEVQALLYQWKRLYLQALPRL